MIDVTALRPSTVWALLVGFIALLGAVTALILTGHDPNSLVAAGVTLAGVLGLGAHQAVQGKTIAKIDKQTNGVLTGRIKAAVREALSEEKNHVIATTPVGVEEETAADVTAEPTQETPNPPAEDQAPEATTEAPVTPDPSGFTPEQIAAAVALLKAAQA